MFTGIITHLGKIVLKSETKITVGAKKFFLGRLKKGTSVSLNGICLTVTSLNKHSFAAHCIPETVRRTNIAHLKKGQIVNLELPVTAWTLLSGHIVSGHIDGIGKLEKMTTQKNSRLLTFFIPHPLSRYMVEKGSVTVNGISLTVIRAGKNFFTVGIIPYTWQHTMLHEIRTGDYVNIETDILGKYLEKFLKKKKTV